MSTTSIANDGAYLAIARFLNAAKMDRTLSPNTLSAYRTDLTTLANWLAERYVPIMSTTRVDLEDYMAWRVRAGSRPTSMSRQLSSFRRFFRYFIRQAALSNDPTAEIRLPRISRSLPRSLTEEEVEALLSAPVAK